MYDPSLLFGVPRSNARKSMAGEGFHGFGEDVWHAYELSWLNERGIPQMYAGTFSIPASSPQIVESKSLKLYLNSLNNHRFPSSAMAVDQIRTDVAEVVGAEIGFEISVPDHESLAGVVLPSEELAEDPEAVPVEPDASMMTAVDGSDHVHTHRLRSLCPVTAQPDWATVIIETRGRSAERRGLLAYLLAYRDHQEFHEQCVERIFVDLQERLVPDFLSVQALYTRRGGLDICPWRCSEDLPAPRCRLNRQ